MSVHYQLQITDISAHLVSIVLRFTPQAAKHQLTLPSWIPGSYLVRNFARHIVHIRAKDAAGSLALQQLDKQSWQLSCRSTPVEVEYQIYANDLSVRAAYLDDEVAILNPACLCLAVSGLTQQPHHLTLLKPHQTCTQPWRVATALRRAADTPFLAFGDYCADNYDHLIDSPIVAGVFSLEQFSLDGVPHYIVVTGDTPFAEATLRDDVEKICKVQRDVFGALPEDLDQYWFLLWVTEQGYGGLEHQFSTLLLCNRYDLPTPNSTAPDEQYQTLLGLFSHEYFHTWWVKRLKPSCFTPYQLDKEQYSRQLWIYEGFTSYFDDLALVKSGIISQRQYLTLLEKLITRVTRNPSNSQQSLADSSFTAWTKFYLQDENAVNSVVSYYAKGALVALLLEAELQHQGTDLASLCRTLYQDYLATGTADSSIFQTLTAMGFNQLAAALDHWVHKAAPLPLADYLPKLGLALNLRAPTHFDDNCGTNEQATPASLGCSLKYQPQGVVIQQLFHGSAAHQAGLMSGDQLVALAGYKITEKSLPQLLKRLPLGSVQNLLFFRKDRLLSAELKLRHASETVAMLKPQDEAKVTSWLTAPAN